MRNRVPLACSNRRRKRSLFADGFRKTLKKASRFALVLAVIAPCIFFNAAPHAPAQVRTRTAAPTFKQERGTLNGTRARASAQAVVNLEELAKQQALAPSLSGPTMPRAIRPPMSFNDSPGVPLPGDVFGVTLAPGLGGKSATSDVQTTNAAVDDPGEPLAPSPAPEQNYRAHNDVPLGCPAEPGGTTVIPPDTMGAVGLTKNLVMLNSNFVVQDKATGAQLMCVSTESFWAATGASGAYDPRVQYDPYNHRWLVAAISNAQTANSSVLVGISNTPDPQGTFTLFRFIVGCAAGATGCDAEGEQADFPMLGFNKNWVAISWNQFSIGFPVTLGGRILVFDYPTLRTGTAISTLFGTTEHETSTTVSAMSKIGFSNHPATTYSPTEPALYLAQHLDSGDIDRDPTYRLNRITGTPSAPVLNLDPVARVRPGGAWSQGAGNNLPQACTPPACTGAMGQPRGIEVADAQIRSNVVFRNGRIYYPQTVALPAGGLHISNSRFAAQWTALNPDGTFADGGRVEDPTATLTNGGRHYAYASLSVNKNNDILLGFSEFESDDNPDAGYTFRLGTDAPGTMRDPVIYKDGLGYYEKTATGTRNRWGDYSHTVVDPLNDRDMWTIQEVADAPVGTGNNSGRWDTWWAKVIAPAGEGDLLISEFRLRGPGSMPGSSASDEFIEIYNNSDAPLIVKTVDGSAGYSIVASSTATLGDNQPLVTCTISNNTTIPARGHWLCRNAVGYSLQAYPAGVGTSAEGDDTYVGDIPDNAGLALFRSATEFTLKNRLDAVGSTSETDTLYKEGDGYPPLSGAAYIAGLNYAWVRDQCGYQGDPAIFGSCPSAGFPVDNDNNAVDFFYVDTSGTDAGAGLRLGAPGPENLSSPIKRGSGFIIFPLDQTKSSTQSPNRERPTTSGTWPSTLGTLEIRRRYVNNTGQTITRLRFRFVDLSTLPSAPGRAQLHALTSTDTTVDNIQDPATCGAAQTPPASQPTPPCTVTVRGTVLEQPPSQPNGGGFNSTLSVPVPALAPGASINVRFVFGVQATGSYKFSFTFEVLP